MDFNRHPEYLPVEEIVRRARAERAAAIGDFIGSVVAGAFNGMKRLAASLGDGLSAERDRRAIEADAFLKRAVPRY